MNNSLAIRHFQKKLSGLVAEDEAGGFLKAPSYYILCSVFFLFASLFGFNDGIFDSVYWLMMIQVLSLFLVLAFSGYEIMALLRLMLIFLGLSASEMYSCKVFGRRGEVVMKLVFTRPIELMGKRGSLDRSEKGADSGFAAGMDCPPDYLEAPEEVIGDLCLDIGARLQVPIKTPLQIIGFKRFRVTYYKNIKDWGRPHIMVPIIAGSSVYVVGDIETSTSGLSIKNNAPLLIIEKKALLRFIAYNMGRITFVVAGLMIALYPLFA